MKAINRYIRVINPMNKDLESMRALQSHHVLKKTHHTIQSEKSLKSPTISCIGGARWSTHVIGLNDEMMTELWM